MKKHELIYNDLKQRILLGRYRTDEKLPSEEELAKKYNTSRVPVQQALNALANMHMVRRLPGSGTYVTYESTLNTTSNRNIVLLLYHMDEESNRILEGVQNVMREQGLFVTTRFLEFDPSFFQKTMEELEKQEISGAIIYAKTTNEWVPYYKAVQKKLPLVFIDQYPNQLLCNCVMSDPQQGMNKLVEHLVENGHKRIGFICLPLQHSVSLKYRFQMIEMALRFHGLQLEKRDVCFSRDYDKFLYTMLASADRPTALIFAMADMFRLSLGLFDQMGVRIPEDISLVTYDQLKSLVDMGRQITHVSQDYYGIGVKAAERLFDLMVNPNQSYIMEYLPVEFNDRGSVKNLVETPEG